MGKVIHKCHIQVKLKESCSLLTNDHFIFAEKAVNGEEEHMRSPAKSDTLRSTDSASGGETLEERSSREVIMLIYY